MGSLLVWQSSPGADIHAVHVQWHRTSLWITTVLIFGGGIGGVTAAPY